MGVVVCGCVCVCVRMCCVRVRTGAVVVRARVCLRAHGYACMRLRTGPLLCLRIGVGLVIGDLAHGTMGDSRKRTDLPSCLLLAVKLGSRHRFFEELVI